MKVDDKTKELLAKLYAAYGDREAAIRMEIAAGYRCDEAKRDLQRAHTQLSQAKDDVDKARAALETHLCQSP